MNKKRVDTSLKGIQISDNLFPNLHGTGNTFVGEPAHVEKFIKVLSK